MTIGSAVSELVAAHRSELAERGVHLRLLAIDDVVFDERTVLKCRYACPAWGRRWTCNADTWGPAELIPLLRRYRAVILLTGVDSRAVSSAALEMERAAFAAGGRFALAVAATFCSACAECGYPEQECRNKIDLRPESPLAGIDTLETLRRAGVAAERPEGWVRAAYVFVD